MNIIISKEVLENEMLLNHLEEHSYYIKILNRDYDNFKEFKRQMKIIYKERPADKINNVVDSVEMVASIIDTLK